VFGWMTGVETKFEMADCQQQADRAECSLSMVNVCTAALGLPAGLNGKLEFAHRPDGKVGQARLTWDTDPRFPDYSKFMTATDGWAMANRPEEVAAEQKLDREGGSIVAKIQNAMSAAPGAIARDATIVDWPAPGGDLAVLRKGSNDWTCYPDWTVSPGNDPECNDPVMEAWFRALLAGEKEPPPITGPGISYMLMGGSDPSNTDPTATAPAPGEDWVNSGPHIMLLVPGGFDAKQFSTDPRSGGPYIMWESTAYEHVMLPVADMPQ
jgi:hypothetical protein